MSSRKHWPRPRSLGRQLAIGVSVIVSTSVIGVGAVAVMGLRDEVVTMSNSQVANSLAAFNYSYAKSKLGVTGTQRLDGPPALETALDAFPGQSPGTVIAVIRDGRVVSSSVFTDGEPTPAPSDVVGALEAVDWRGADTMTVRLGSLGAHRAGSRDLGGGERLVSGVSLRAANETVARNTLIIAILVVLALVASAAGTVAVVGRALRPLRRVAGIAAHVATLPIESAEYRITARVSDEDSDSTDEVGVVGHTINLMLDNVDTALARMAESDRVTRQFLTDASHELRTPLASILGYAELTRQDSELLPPTTEYALERIEAESRRMASLVADLLMLSRLDEGYDLEIADVDVCDLIRDAVNDASVAAANHLFCTDLPAEPVWVRGDRLKLQQLLANLLGNARVHTPPGTTVTVSVAALSAGELPCVEITVADDGPGIPEDVLPTIFGRFVRVDKARSRELGCSGLGLAIVSSIADAHHGSATAESRPGRTAFTVRIPKAHLPEGDSVGIPSGVG